MLLISVIHQFVLYGYFDKAQALNSSEYSLFIQNEAQNNHDLLAYEDNTFGMRLVYPIDWGYKETKYFFVRVKGIQLFPIAEVNLKELKSSDSKTISNEWVNSPVRFGIERDDSTPFKNMPLDQYKEFDISRLEVNGWNVSSIYKTTIGNNVEAYQINYAGPIEKGMDILFVKPSDAFQIYYISYNELHGKYLPAVERMINSIQFSK